jgi:hypothetical protein
MKPEIKQAWLTALRSGEYSQAKDRLKTRTGYCCYGVLCDLYQKAHPETSRWVEGGVDATFIINPSLEADSEPMSTMPNETVMMWAGLPKPNDLSITTLSEMNDEGATFPQIANRIEEQF